MFWLVAALTITLVLQRNVIYDEGYMTSLRWLSQEKSHGAFRFPLETLEIKKSDRLSDHRSSCTAATAALEVPTAAVSLSLPGCHPFPLGAQRLVV